jgi:hypothetical protein
MVQELCVTHNVIALSFLVVLGIPLKILAISKLARQLQ